LTALSAVHDLLLRDRSDHAQLKELVEGALDPFGLDRCNLSGCEIIIPPKLALNLAMVFHELATNAEKYGALSSPSGSVEIDWCLEPPHDLAIVWKERGGPLVIRPKRKGFGSRLLSRALKGSLNGSIEIDYDPQGIECRIRAALPETR
jgi:two-component sensor histidine kinase